MLEDRMPALVILYQNGGPLLEAPVRERITVSVHNLLPNNIDRGSKGTRCDPQPVTNQDSDLTHRGSYTLQRVARIVSTV